MNKYFKVKNKKEQQLHDIELDIDFQIRCLLINQQAIDGITERMAFGLFSIPALLWGSSLASATPLSALQQTFLILSFCCTMFALFLRHRAYNENLTGYSLYFEEFTRQKRELVSGHLTESDFNEPNVQLNFKEARKHNKISFGFTVVSCLLLLSTLLFFLFPL